MYHFSEFNSDYRCAVCNNTATAYIHGEGYLCGGCNEKAPEARRGKEG